MRKNTDIIKFLKLLFLIPAIVLLFACSGTTGGNSAVDSSIDANEQEIRHRECWQASVVGAIYDTTSHITMGMYSHMTQGAMALMMVAFAVWLSFRIIKHVSSFTEESPAEVWTEVMKKFFICMVCGLLATSTTGVLWVLNSIVFPIYNAFLDLGSHMLAHFAGSEGGGSAYAGYEMETWMRVSNGIIEPTTEGAASIAGSLGAEKTSNFLSEMYIPFDGYVQANYNVLCTVSNMDPATPESFPMAPRQMMECMTCAINERLNFGYKLGWIIITQDGFMALICGLIMMCLFTFVKLGFVFYLVDTMFRFAMMVLILPLLIMAYAFKPTRKWTQKGFLTIINSAAFMMCIAIVILMAMAAIQQILVDNRGLLEGDKTSLADFSKPLMMLMLVGFLLVGSMDIAKSIADSLIQGGGTANFQKQFGAAAMKTGKWALMGIGGAVGGMIVANSAKLRAARDATRSVKTALTNVGKSLTGEDENDDDD